MFLILTLQRDKTGEGRRNIVMYNLVYLIGRLTVDPEINRLENEKQVLTINLAVQRGYKNPDGIYEADFIRCVLWDGIAERTSQFCKKGDLVGVRGQIRTSSYVNANNEKKHKTEILVEKITFLASKSGKSDIGLEDTLEEVT